MKLGMTLPDLVTEVQRRSAAKHDVVRDTREGVRLDATDDGVMLRVGDDTYDLSENAHRQVSAFTKIPHGYYERLLTTHRDILARDVNTLFEREPAARMLRMLDRKCRAFLSDRYRRIDNDLVLSKALPILVNKSDDFPQTEMLGSYLTDDAMRLKVLFTGDEYTFDLGPLARGTGRDLIRPGFEIGNSETGLGSYYIRGFFYRNFCRNGAIYQFGDDAVAYSRTHLGPRQAAGNLTVLSEETLRKEDEAILSATVDVMRAFSSRDNVNRLYEALMASRRGERVDRPEIAVKVLGNEVGLFEGEIASVLRNLIDDGDLTRYGMLNAVTAVANEDQTSVVRALELEEVGGKILTMSETQWHVIATATRDNSRRVREAA